MATEFTIVYWYWLILGMLLIIFELFVPSFTIIWFGLGALLTAGFLWLMPDTSFAAQLFIWAMASIVFTVAWFKMFKQLVSDRTKAGISREAILGETGRVIRSKTDEKRGIVRFTVPLLGNDEWMFICEQHVAVGDRVIVLDISGNTLIVQKT